MSGNVQRQIWGQIRLPHMRERGKKRPQQRVEGQEGKESDESDGHNIAHDDFYISFN